jgi:hypothetical protein
LAANGISARTDPKIRVVDNKLSIQAEGVPLSRLLGLLREATGITYKVPPHLANRGISVWFENLDLNDAVHKIFEGQSLDYVWVEGKSIIVTGMSQNLNLKNNPAPATAAAPTPAQGTPPATPSMNPVNPPPYVPPPNPNQHQLQPPAAANANPNSPVLVQTPFGAIPNPQPGQVQPAPATQPPQQSAQPGYPSNVVPGQGALPNPFNTTLPGFIGPNVMQNYSQGTSTTAPAVNSPFNSPTFNTSPSGSPNNIPNNVFPPQ